jgi:hypothetical protein
MRTLFAAAWIVTLLTGCTTPGSMRTGVPVLSGTTAKSTSDFAACVSDKWTEKYPTVSMLPRQNGIAIQIGHPGAGLDSLIDIEKREGGSAYKYYERIPSLTPAFNADGVKNCI